MLDLPADAAHGAYYPYDGIIRTVPGVYVDRDTGDQIKAAAAAGATARVALPAEVKRVSSRNLIGLIPGASDELMLLHCHTDGTNGVEDNGPNAIVAMSQYLARLPRHALPRTIMVLLTTGHFHGCDRNRRVRAPPPGRTVAPHRGRRHDRAPWRAGVGARVRRALRADRRVSSLERSSLPRAARSSTLPTPHCATPRPLPSSVLRPYVAAPGSPDGNGWPAEGTDLWTMGAIPTSNYITGPSYLLNWGIPTMDKLDVARMRREAIAFTQMLLDLSRVPRSRLRRLDLLGHAA